MTLTNFIQKSTENLTTKQGIIDTLTGTLSEWWRGFIEKLPNIVVAIAVLMISIIIARFLKKLILKILRKQMDNRSIRRIIAKLIYIIVIAMGFFLALGILDLDKALTSILAGAGVVALAIGLALQSTLSNTFSGVMLSFLPRIRIGDYIETNEHTGFVEEISMRNLVLRRPDNMYIIMPNSKFINEPFINYSLEARGRVTVSCGIAYGTNLHKTKEMVTKAINSKFTQQNNEKVEFYYTEFGDSSINFIVRFWIDFVKKSEMYVAQDAAIILINDLFNEHDIEIPYPIRTVLLKKDTD